MGVNKSTGVLALGIGALILWAQRPAQAQNRLGLAAETQRQWLDALARGNAQPALAVAGTLLKAGVPVVGAGVKAALKAIRSEWQAQQVIGAVSHGRAPEIETAWQEYRAGERTASASPSATGTVPPAPSFADWLLQPEATRAFTLGVAPVTAGEIPSLLLPDPVAFTESGAALPSGAPVYSLGIAEVPGLDLPNPPLYTSGVFEGGYVPPETSAGFGMDLTLEGPSLDVLEATRVGWDAIESGQVAMPPGVDPSTVEGFLAAMESPAPETAAFANMQELQASIPGMEYAGTVLQVASIVAAVADIGFTIAGNKPDYVKGVVVAADAAFIYLAATGNPLAIIPGVIRLVSGLWGEEDPESAIRDQERIAPTLDEVRDFRAALGLPFESMIQHPAFIRTVEVADSINRGELTNIRMTPQPITLILVDQVNRLPQYRPGYVFPGWVGGPLNQEMVGNMPAVDTSMYQIAAEYSDRLTMAGVSPDTSWYNRPEWQQPRAIEATVPIGGDSSVTIYSGYAIVDEHGEVQPMPILAIPPPGYLEPAIVPTRDQVMAWLAQQVSANQYNPGWNLTQGQVNYLVPIVGPAYLENWRAEWDTRAEWGGTTARSFEEYALRKAGQGYGRSDVDPATAALLASYGQGA